MNEEVNNLNDDVKENHLPQKEISRVSKGNGAFSVGGQAIIEGIMMRSPNRISIAVRKPDDEIVVKGWHFESLTKSNKILGIPLVRGIVNLGEMLYWGIKTLQDSAHIAMGETEKNPPITKKILSALSMTLGLAAGVLLFAYLPLWIANLLGFREKPFLFNLLAGVVRVILFLGYLIAISSMKDVRRLFQYHGAEHKTIHAFERGEPLTVERVQKYSTFHPRCGTSFILIVAVMAIFLFAAFDGFVYLIWHFAPKPIVRLPFHLLLLPFLAGISYEILKISDKLARKSSLGKIFVAPGLWIQKITTKQPDDSMVEVAIKSLLDSISEISIGTGK
ncbi:DUF1385 domain-containing protein [bacterium]|nr:DUF1385 domain-containing protein [bacterium]